MSRYQHTKGQIKDNAIEALLHDPLFRQRVEKIRKGKAVTCEKENMAIGDWEASGKKVNHFLPLAFCFQALVKSGYSALSANHEFLSVILLL